MSNSLNLTRLVGAWSLEMIIKEVQANIPISATLEKILVHLIDHHYNILDQANDH